MCSLFFRGMDMTKKPTDTEDAQHTAPSSAHLGSPRANARAPGNLQLEESFDPWRPGPLAVLFSNPQRQHQEPAGHRVSPASPAAYDKVIAPVVPAGGWHIQRACDLLHRSSRCARSRRLRHELFEGGKLPGPHELGSVSSTGLPANSGPNSAAVIPMSGSNRFFRG